MESTFVKGRMKLIELVIVFLLWTGRQVTMATLFGYGAGAGDTQEGVFDQFTRHITPLPYSFTFAGVNYDGLYVSDNGAISFADTASTYLNIVDFSISGQWLAPLGFDIHGGTNIWYNHYSGSDAQLQEASSLVNQFTGSGSYVAEYLTVITWEDVWRTFGEVNTFQVAITRSTSESYVLFLYGTLQVQGDVMVGISLGDDVNSVFAWDGGGPPAGCADPSSASDLAQRSQTACGTDAGVLVFAVHDTATFNTDPVCTHIPQSGCTTAIAVDRQLRLLGGVKQVKVVTTLLNMNMDRRAVNTAANPNKIARCHARRKRSDRIDL